MVRLARIKPHEQPLSRLKKESRPVFETPLLLWLREKGITKHAFSHMADTFPVNITWWSNGRQLPGLIAALRIEKVTRGEVPASSWLGTPLGQEAWNRMSVDWKKFNHSRADDQTARRDRRNPGRKKRGPYAKARTRPIPYMPPRP